MSVAGWLAIGALWVLVILLGLTVLALARQIGVLHERLQPVGALALPKGLAAGEPAPEIAVETLTGQPLRIGGAHPRGAETLVMFVSPTCPICKSLLPALRAIRRRERPPVEVVLASDGPKAEHLAFVAAESLEEFPYVLSERLGLGYGAGRLPHAVLLDPAGTVRATGLVNSREHLDSLFEARDRGVGSLQEYLERSARRDVA
ncbi:MAG: redoxin domain-containing protein [Gemmatimonadetes bacterium]|nr:redoxin domain-containing protein [Gemmatimonadota bacterium]MCC7131321.1 redoxin domain-containing protein [Gemmatimonadales bacterium]